MSEIKENQKVISDAMKFDFMNSRLLGESLNSIGVRHGVVGSTVSRHTKAIKMYFDVRCGRIQKRFETQMQRYDIEIGKLNGQIALEKHKNEMLRNELSIMERKQDLKPIADLVPDFQKNKYGQILGLCWHYHDKTVPNMTEEQREMYAKSMENLKGWKEQQA